ncbi:MAG: DUF5071 domain-containing protein [Clostridia bacterium]|nr:DUF5071 domain-containing protein [Clostridia bacterium]
MIDIDTLDWSLPISEQSSNIARYQPVNDNEIPCLILPFRKKNCWRNCAILLSTIDNSRLAPFLPQILEWYKDLNWPGFEIISKLIRRFSNEQIIEAVHIASHRALIEDDMEWYENLLCSFPSQQ